MIIQETLENDLVRTYSDQGVLIHGGFPEGDYAEAVDPISLGRVYIETNIPIETEEDDDDDDDQSIEDEYAAAGRILMGVEE